MRKFIAAALLISSVIYGQIEFDNYFLNKSIRFDYYHAGDKNTEYFYFDRLTEEPFWSGAQPLDTLNLGNSMIKVYDKASNKMIFSKGYSTLFKEWQTTDEALVTKRAILECVQFPFPKKSVTIKLFTRNRENEFIERFTYDVDPGSMFIARDRNLIYDTYLVHKAKKDGPTLDIVLIPDGYSQDELDKFRRDAKRFSGYLFEYEPFSNYSDEINIWCVLAPSKESGIDIPGDNVYKQTVVSTSFYTFGSERYVMTYDTRAVYDAAANAPYDQIYILSNSEKYGGGSIYNYYSVTTVDNKQSKQVFIHEFGHGFAGLADEYFTSDVAYNEFYPVEVEPWEKNITTLVRFESKWKSMLDEDTPVPTPDNIEFDNKTGVFEGGGYAAKGVYRSSRNSLMNSFSSNEFNPVSKQALREVIEHFTK